MRFTTLKSSLSHDSEVPDILSHNCTALVDCNCQDGRIGLSSKIASLSSSDHIKSASPQLFRDR